MHIESVWFQIEVVNKFERLKYHKTIVTSWLESIINPFVSSVVCPYASLQVAAFFFQYLRAKTIESKSSLVLDSFSLFSSIAYYILLPYFGIRMTFDDNCKWPFTRKSPRNHQEPFTVLVIQGDAGRSSWTDVTSTMCFDSLVSMGAHERGGNGGRGSQDQSFNHSNTASARCEQLTAVEDLKKPERSQRWWQPDLRSS